MPPQRVLRMAEPGCGVKAAWGSLASRLLGRCSLRLALARLGPTPTNLLLRSARWLFQDEEIYSDLYLTVCGKWPSDAPRSLSSASSETWG